MWPADFRNSSASTFWNSYHKGQPGPLPQCYSVCIGRKRHADKSYYSLWLQMFQVLLPCVSTCPPPQIWLQTKASAHQHPNVGKRSPNSDSIIRRQCYLSKSPSGVKLSGSIIVDNMTKRTTVIRTPFLRSKHINTFILKYIYQYLELLKIEHDERKTGVSAQTKWLLQGELHPINSNNK